MAQLQPYKGGYYLWKYVPSVEAAAIFCVLFLFATAAHSWRVWKTRTWFCIPFAIGGYFEVIGYATRAAAHDRTGKLMPYAIQNQQILLAPALFAASIYMTLSRTIRSVNGERYSIVRADWLTRIFVLGDVLSFVVQGSAVGLMVTGGNNAVAGQWIVVTGLLIQMIMFALFGLTALLFHVRMRRDPMGLRSQRQTTAAVNWERSLHMLYGVSVLVMVRSVFRVIEFILGPDGYPLTHEWTLYVFDSVPMLVVMIIFWQWFPSPRPSRGWEEVCEPLRRLSGQRLESK
ncbi:RTA1 like protein [Diplogelasinospora grovesii]|uniref:RTA1 like protein n=1 Tax=Diplogelasinospora grovesii TaxID=303347 RepID=A0AAN6MVW6_9PEZI|nr:RTA1 like protein [Diplogelasinospora grovesii]